MPIKGSGLGTRINHEGYVQIIRRGPLHGKLEHRVVMAGMCREFCYYPLGEDGLPDGMEVHHQDFYKTHNCRSNLFPLDPSLRLRMDRNQRDNRDRRENGDFGANPAPPDGAVVQYTVFHCRDCGKGRRVPVSWYLPEDVPDWVTEDTPT